MADEFDTPEHGPDHGPLRDNSVLWRLSIWGGAATVAVAAAVLLVQSDLGLDRMVQALTQSAPEKQVVATDELVKRAETQRIEETRRLEARIRELLNDREKLNSRIATLEQNFGDLTGSIKRDVAAIVATAKPVVPATPAPALAAPPVTTAPQAAEPAPAPKLDAKVEPKIEPKIEAKPEPKIEAKVEPKPEAKPEAAPSGPSGHAMPAPEPKVVSDVPMPPAAPTRVASAPTNTPATEGRPADVGIELGGARSQDILNARWVAVKANFGPLIEGLSPLMRHEEKANIPYRLIVGPVANRAAAAQLCARFAQSKVPCRTTDFTGDKFAQ